MSGRRRCAAGEKTHETRESTQVLTQEREVQEYGGPLRVYTPPYGVPQSDGTAVASLGKSMDAAQRAHWHEKGWIVVKDALSPELIAQANEIYDAHLDGSVKVCDSVCACVPPPPHPPRPVPPVRPLCL